MIRKGSALLLFCPAVTTAKQREQKGGRFPLHNTRRNKKTNSSRAAVRQKQNWERAKKKHKDSRSDYTFSVMLLELGRPVNASLLVLPSCQSLTRALSLSDGSEPTILCATTLHAMLHPGVRLWNVASCLYDLLPKIHLHLVTSTSYLSS